MNYRVAKNRRKARTHRPERVRASRAIQSEPMITCKPSGRIMSVSEYARIYHNELAARDAYWRERNAASLYHPRLGR